MSRQAGLFAGRGVAVTCTAAVLALTVLAVHLARPRSGQTALGGDVRSSFRTTPDGVAALYETVSALGVPAAPRMTPLVDADDIRGTLVLLEPTERPSPREVNALLDWVRQGGTLLYAPRLQLRNGPAVLDSLGLTLLEPRDGASNPRWERHRLTRDLPPPRPPRRFVAVPAKADTAGRPPPASMQPLLSADLPDSLTAGATAAAAEIVLGRGRIVALADAEPLSNEHAGDDPLAVLAVRAVLAHTTPGDTVFFDEFHHGVRGLGSPAEAATDFFLGTGGGRALLHLGGVALLALAAAGARLGTPADPPTDERRSPMEHVSALARLYQAAGARDTAALLLLSRAARAARTAPPKTLAEARAMVGTMEARSDSAPAWRLVRQGLQAEPRDLKVIAAGIDEYCQRRRRP